MALQELHCSLVAWCKTELDCLPGAALLRWQARVQILTLTAFYSDLLTKVLGMNCLLCYFPVFSGLPQSRCGTLDVIMELDWVHCFYCIGFGERKLSKQP